MSSFESSHHAVSMKDLARRDAVAPPPYGYEEFAQRHHDARRRRRAMGATSAASVALVAVLAGLGLRDSRSPAAFVAVAPDATRALPRAASPDDDASLPALIEADRFVLRSDLEDRIAWFDSALSAGGALPDQDLHRLQSTRDELARSLQQVTYAHAVLDL